MSKYQQNIDESIIVGDELIYPNDDPPSNLYVHIDSTRCPKVHAIGSGKRK